MQEFLSEITSQFVFIGLGNQTQGKHMFCYQQVL
jgi:hypothetical protein